MDRYTHKFTHCPDGTKHDFKRVPPRPKLNPDPFIMSEAHCCTRCGYWKFKPGRGISLTVPTIVAKIEC